MGLGLPGRLSPPGKWEAARLTRVSTIRHVSKAARAECSRTLGAIVAEVLDEPGNIDAWLKLYILPRCVLLAKPGEQGAKIWTN